VPPLGTAVVLVVFALLALALTLCPLAICPFALLPLVRGFRTRLPTLRTLPSRITLTSLLVG
jgi:hypothetical protein